MALTIGLDIGTTSTIGILIDTDGATLALASAPVRAVLRPAGLGRAGPRAVVAQRLRGDRPSCCAGRRPPGRATSPRSASPACCRRVVLLDRAGRLLRRSIQQSDGRTGREVAELAAEVDPGGLRAAHRQRHQPAAGRAQAALDRAPRAGRVRPHRDRVRLLRLPQLAPHRRPARSSATGRWRRASSSTAGRRARPRRSWRSATSIRRRCRRSARARGDRRGHAPRRPRRPASPPARRSSPAAPITSPRRSSPASAATAICCSSSAGQATSCSRPTGRSPIRACSSTTTSCPACSCPTAAWRARARC